MYILASNGNAEKYPYTIGQLLKDNPQTSFPSNLSDTLLAAWNVYPVAPTPQPTADHMSNVAEVTPTLIDGSWIQTWSLTAATPEEIEERTVKQVAAVRADRNRRLSASDWTQLPDAPVDATAWAAYRQALRDVTAQAGFPWDVTWPAPPA